MNSSKAWALLGTALSCLSAAATAQTAGGGTAAVEGAPSPDQKDSTGFLPDDGKVPGDIIVTARRVNESLQNVPSSVSVVSGEKFKELNFSQFTDLASLVPGLSLGRSSGGGDPAPSLRGLTFEQATAAPSTVVTYVNEVFLDPGNAFAAIYDLGSVEVLRGPQGTLRGRPSPSGAITLTTHRPDARSTGGYASAFATDRDSYNLQGAVNLPVVKDVLAVRVAGLFDRSDGNFVQSVNNPAKPYVRTVSGRASLQFTPSSTFDANLTYQYLRAKSRQYNALVGSGAPGGIVPNSSPARAAPAAGYNGPALAADDRETVAEEPMLGNRYYHLVTGQANWEVLSHRLSYVGGYFNYSNVQSNDIDPGNLLVGASPIQLRDTKGHVITQELRLASDHVSKLFDYVIGYHYFKTVAQTAVTQPGAFLNGAFGPTNSDPFTYNTRYILPAIIGAPLFSYDHAVFGTVTLHLDKRTELVGGLRWIISRVNRRNLTVNVGQGFVAVQLPPAFCTPAGGVASVYPGYCDFAVPNQPPTVTASTERSHPIVYSASLSHRFSDSVLAYANVASSYRGGASNTGINNASNDPGLNSIIFTNDERSTNYEIGLKTNLFQRRLRLNIAVFRQKFNGLIFRTQPVPYLSNNGREVRVVASPFTVNADSTIDGFDIDGDLRLTRNWSLSGAVSFTDGRIDNDFIPCRDVNGDGVPDADSPILPTVANFTAQGRSIAFCRSNASVSRDPKWNATIQSEYRYPLGRIDAYVRGLANIYPSNDRRDQGFKSKGYALFNLYAGVRSREGAWDAGVFVKNATGAKILLSREFYDVGLSSSAGDRFGFSGYNNALLTAPREFGLSVRYAFGSR